MLQKTVAEFTTADFMWVVSGNQKSGLIDWLLESRFITYSVGEDKNGKTIYRLFRGSKKIGIIACASQEIANMVMKCINIALSRLNNFQESRNEHRRNQSSSSEGDSGRGFQESCPGI